MYAESYSPPSDLEESRAREARPEILFSLEGDTGATFAKAGKNGIAQPYKKFPWDRATFFEQNIRQFHELERKYDRATGRVFKSDVHFM